MPSEMLKGGCDVVTFSGDKLLGGPQAGIIVGTKKYIDLIRRHPMKRALRLSKLPLLALEATLKLYLQPERLKPRLPTLRWLTRDPEQIMHTAQTLAPVLEKVLLNKCSVAVVEMLSQIGSGSLPVDLLPSFGVELRPILSKGETLGSTLNALMKALRALPTPVIGRIEKDTIRLDCRCIESGETLEELMQTLSQLSHLSSQIQSSQALTGAA
jgi:L-seryl-tRNA(Ser) seleniumtransferase